MPKAKTPRTTTNGKTKTTTTATPEVQLASTPAVTAPVTTEVVKEVARIEAVKPETKTAKRPEARKNVFPINLDEEIRRRAYELSEQRGFTPGHENEDWLIAEREILARYTQQQTA